TAVWPLRTRQAGLSPYHVGLGVGNDASGLTEHRLARCTSLACPEAVSWRRTPAHFHSYPPPTNSGSSDRGGERGQGDRIILMILPPQGNGGGRLALEQARDGSQALRLLRPSGWGWPLLHLLPVAYA